MWVPKDTLFLDSCKAVLRIFKAHRFWRLILDFICIVCLTGRLAVCWLWGEQISPLIQPESRSQHISEMVCLYRADFRLWKWGAFCWWDLHQWQHERDERRWTSKLTIRHLLPRRNTLDSMGKHLAKCAVCATASIEPQKPIWILMYWWNWPHRAAMVLWAAKHVIDWLFACALTISACVTLYPLGTELGVSLIIHRHWSRTLFQARVVKLFLASKMMHFDLNLHKPVIVWRQPEAIFTVVTYRHCSHPFKTFVWPHC